MAMATAACHVTSHSEITRPGTTTRTPHLANAVARRPSIVLTEAGKFRFVELLECPTEEVVTEQRARETVRGPNLATFVVGVIATAVGGVLLVGGVTDREVSNPLTYAGAGLVVVGLPFAFGPWIGNGSELTPLDETGPITRPGPSQGCGERPLATATSATLGVRGLEVFGRVDPDGVFAVSPFDIVDAYEPGTAAWTIAARLDAIAGARTVDAVVAGRAFEAAASQFLAHADFDGRVEALRLVPGIAPGTLRVSLTQTADGPAARIVLAVTNDGPGAAYGLRGHIAAPGTPALDGRILYFGHVAKGATLSRELLVPLAPAAADALRNATLELGLELRDAHGTAPTTPVRFRGAMLVDAPR